MCVIMSLVEESEVQDDKIKKPAEFTNKKTRRVPGKTAPGASRRSY